MMKLNLATLCCFLFPCVLLINCQAFRFSHFPQQLTQSNSLLGDDPSYEPQAALDPRLGLKQLYEHIYHDVDFMEKRAPALGFYGMRGKKIPGQNFFGMRGKKGPSGFLGMRGKKFAPMMESDLALIPLRTTDTGLNLLEDKEGILISSAEMVGAPGGPPSLILNPQNDSPVGNGPGELDPNQDSKRAPSQGFLGLRGKRNTIRSPNGGRSG